jgi:type IV pilus assembly protein PilN
MLDYNFFSPYIMAERSVKRKTLIIAAIFVVLVVFIGGGFLTSEMLILKLQEDIKPMQTYLNSKETLQKLQEAEKNKKKLEIMGRYYNAVDAITLKIGSINTINSSLIEKIAKTLPSDITFKSLSLTNSSITIQGTASSRVPVAEFEHNLVSLNIFREVHVKDIKQDGKDQNNNNFDIECTLKDVAGK